MPSPSSWPQVWWRAATASSRGPFVNCRRAYGFFQNSCGNCKWRDHATRCKVEDEENKDKKDYKEDSSNEKAEGAESQGSEPVAHDPIKDESEDENDAPTSGRLAQ